ncbi:uncharacterized protein LOC133897084 [Phragmites australis]|uniref:uncharacterized protein LOC133897084 n=1 Tax=Phragmites australis TaxID=29695 RepID=UPI002D783F0C|nr:uncharacterized protein LOC133897084 [Phragmites australis]
MTNSDGDPRPNCRSMWLRRQRAKTSCNGPRVLLTTTKAPCQQGEASEDAQNTMPVLELDKLPEDIFHHIHTLVPLRDAARAACVSHRFLRSWRCFPNLTFNQETLGLNVQEGTPYEREKKLMDRIDHIVQNHSGMGVKTLKLKAHPCHNVITADHLDIWFQAVIKSGIMEIAVELPQDHRPKYNFSCSLLSCAGSSLRSLSLFSCAFRPTLRIGCLKSLKSVCLKFVHITGEELGCLFSSTISLEELEVSLCDEIIFLNIPSHLQQLSTLKVFMCKRIQTIEIYAPKVSTFLFKGPPMEIFISNSSQLKYMVMDGVFYSGMIQYARTKLHSIASNLQTLTLLSSEEAFNAPMLPEKFLQLRHLNIYFSGIGFKNYDYFSLVSFLEACPALESFFLAAGDYCNIMPNSILQDSNADSSHIRRIPEFRHANLKKVSIRRFCSTKSLVELTCQLIENSPSLRCLVLDTTRGFYPSGKCQCMYKEDVIKALSAVEAVKRYIEGKVPPSVEFKVREPCRLCHIPKL